jgi:hypothetical protein
MAHPTRRREGDGFGERVRGYRPRVFYGWWVVLTGCTGTLSRSSSDDDVFIRRFSDKATTGPSGSPVEPEGESTLVPLLTATFSVTNLHGELRLKGISLAIRAIESIGICANRLKRAPGAAHYLSPTTRWQTNQLRKGEVHVPQQHHSRLEGPRLSQQPH